MTYKLAFVFLAVSIFATSCINFQSKDKGSVYAFIDTTVFPKLGYTHIRLLVLDSLQKERKRDDNGSSFYDTSIFEHVFGGVSFVKTNGMPKSIHYFSYKLDSSDIVRFKNFLAPQPCLNELHSDKACFPVFRHVFVFYNDKDLPVAQMHICFQCELTAFFSSGATDMCDFDNNVNFKELKQFADSVAHGL